MTHRINFDVLGKKLLQQYPYIANQLIIQPKLTSTSLIPDIHDLFEEQFKTNQRDKQLVFICVIVRLYDPDALEGYKPLKKGLRKILSETLNLYPTQISHHLQKVRDYLPIYADFANHVGYFYEVISKEFDDGKAGSIKKEI